MITADRNALFGKAIITDAELRESLKDLSKGLNVLFEDEEIVTVRDAYLAEMEDEEEAAGGEEDAEGKEDGADEEPAKELDPAEIKKISGELKKVAEKVEDEKLKEKLDGIIGKLDGSIEEGTRPELVKEAIYLLSI